MLDKTTTIEKFLEAAAAKQPTPGGGSVAALAGALAASMGEMVLNYSIGKKGLEDHEPKQKFILKLLHENRELLLQLMEQDQSVYEDLTKARKLPPTDAAREKKIADAAWRSTNVPQLAAVAAVQIMRMADQAVDISNPYLLSDLAVCAELAMATVRASLYNIRVNLPAITDVKQRKEIETRCEKQLARATKTIQRVIPRIWERVSKAQK